MTAPRDGGTRPPRAAPRLPGPRLPGLLLLLLGLTAGGAGRAEESDVPWSYSGDRGPGHWAELTPGFAACASGRLQSPIDIRGVQPAAYTPLSFHYRAQALETVNDGREVYLLCQRGSELRIRGESFALGEIHFHVPGEHRINGVAAAAEMHLLHRDAQGRPLVAAVPIEPGPRGNATLARIVERLPLLPGERVRYRQVGINPLFVLPTDRSYFAYTGSLATPPCSEPVSWILLAEPVALEPALLGRLARAVGPNARPVQPLNGRPIYAHRQH